MTYFSEVLRLATTLFFLMDSLGNIPIYLAVLKKTPKSKQSFIILRELLIALAIILLFSFSGEYILSLLSVSNYTVEIGGGVILFLIALRMLFPPPKVNHSLEQISSDPFIVPLAIPLVAGPAVLASVMMYDHQGIPIIISISAILLAWGASLLVLIASPKIQKKLGSRGILACEKLMGLVLTLISVQMMLEGIARFSASL